MPTRKPHAAALLPKHVQRMLQLPGRPLEDSIRVPLERFFGRDFRHVRVHDDDWATRSARAVGAAAYTAGAHIVFAQGHYKPDTGRGRWLLCHELAHVVQQERSTAIDGSTASHGLLERNADLVADIALSGGSLPARFAFGTAPAGVVQCHDDVPCVGQVVTPDEPGRQGIGGNWAIEMAYKNDPQIQDTSMPCSSAASMKASASGPTSFCPRGRPTRLSATCC